MIYHYHKACDFYLTQTLNLFPLKSPLVLVVISTFTFCTLPFVYFTHWLNNPYSLGTSIKTKNSGERNKKLWGKALPGKNIYLFFFFLHWLPAFYLLTLIGLFNIHIVFSPITMLPMLICSLDTLLDSLFLESPSRQLSFYIVDTASLLIKIK